MQLLTKIIEMNMPRYAWRRALIALVCLSWFSEVAVAQQSLFDTKNWRFMNPTLMGFTFFDVDFVDNSQVFAVGSEGGIAKSTDGGSTWTYGVCCVLVVCFLCSVVVFCVAFGCGFPSCIVSVFLLVLAVVMGSFVLLFKVEFVVFMLCSFCVGFLCCGFVQY